MTQEAFNQIVESARRGDVFAQAILGSMLYEGKVVQQNIEHAVGWLRNAAQCNCLWARDILQEMSVTQTNGGNVQGRSTANETSETNQIDCALELSRMIGLEQVKSDIESLRNLIKVQALRKQQGLPNTAMSLHMVFTGNPGTGKTSVARIVAGTYRELGLLKKGQLVEADRSKLVAEYVGQTAVKTNKIIDEALEGVLFIDEAYTLVGGENDFGAEAIATLLKRMEDDRDRLVVILAGYTDEIKEFIDSNPGLQSRFNRYIHFADYSEAELVEIFKSNLKKNKYKIKKDAFTELQNVIGQAVSHRDKYFGNARYVRNLFEKVVQCQANRLAALPYIDNDQLSIITLDDILSLKRK